ncbi:MAG: peptide ABC transporter substrate-binding protein [Gemmatimonadota bacterium]
MKSSAARWIRASSTLALVSIALGCGDGGGGGGADVMATGEPVRGGRLVVGAEQWPQCLNPVTSCANIAFVNYSVLNHVLPKTMTLDEHGEWVAGPLLAEVPSLENGGLATDPFTVTLHLDPDAVWSDGTPITWEDFEFTWKAIMNTTGTLTVVGYDKITSISGPDPKTVVITFSDIVVDWMDLFGGPTQYLLKKAAFPEADPDAPDLRTEMNTSIPFSGGPWVLESWSREQAVLVRNDAYWREQTWFDQVVFVPREEQTTEINSVLSGEVSVIWPQPSNVSIARQVQSNPNVRVQAGQSPYYEALWFNVERPPLDDTRVREALMYAIDRQSVIDAIIKLNYPEAEVLDCAALSYTNLGHWCDGPEGKPFAKYTYDPQRSMQILTSAGWDCSGVASGRPCRKDGRDLEVEYTTVAGNARRQTTQALLIPKAEAAGFGLTVRNYQAGDLFSNVLPKGEYGMADYAWGGSPDPDIQSILGCESIPTAENGWAGQNDSRWCNERAYDAMLASARELDPEQRRELLRIAYAEQEADHVLLPLYQLPAVSVWRADKVAGPVGLYTESILSVFGNMNEWYCARPGACQ